MKTLRKNNKRLLLSTTDLVMVRFHKVDDDAILDEIQNEVEAIMDQSHFLEGAPFEWITFFFRLGLKTEEAPHYERINKKYGDLPLAIEVNANELKDANHEQFKKLLMRVTLKSLIHVGEKYNLPHVALIEQLEKV